MPDLSKFLTYSGETELDLIVWPLFLGICIGAFAIVFIRVKLGELVRALLSRGACSPETACTLEQLGLKNKRIIRSALRKRSSLRKVISITPIDPAQLADQTAPTAEPTETSAEATSAPFDPATLVTEEQRDQAIDVDSYRYYISEKNKERASSTYDNTGSTVAIALLTVVLALAVAALSMVLIPALMQMFENMVEGFRS